MTLIEIFLKISKTNEKTQLKFFHNLLKFGSIYLFKKNCLYMVKASESNFDVSNIIIFFYDALKYD